MSRRNILYICIAGIAGLLVLGYTSLPPVLSGIAQKFLAAQGMRDVEIRVGYPGIGGIGVHQLRFTAFTGGYKVFCELNDIEVEYHILDLLAGAVERVQIPRATMRAQPAPEQAGPSPPSVPATTPAEKQGAAAPLTILFSGQWLSLLPVNKVQLEKLDFETITASATYKARIAGELSAAEARLTGDITLPTPQTPPVVFVILARSSGETRLTLSTAANTQPMLEWSVDKATVAEDRMVLNGMLHAQLQSWVPVIKTFATQATWFSLLEGKFNTRWQAVLPPLNLKDRITLTLQDIQGQGENWDLFGNIGMQGLGGPGPEQPLSITVTRLGGRYKKMTMAGFSANAALLLGEGVRSHNAARLGVELLDVGLPIKNIAAQFRLGQNKKTKDAVVYIESATAELMGGLARGEPFILDFGQDKNRFQVQLEGMRLDKIMQLEQQQELQGTGLLDGVIPVELSGEGIEVKQGKLAARPPGGVISYQPTEKVIALAQSNVSVQMVVDALANYQYHKLDVTSDYKPTGDLVLRVQLEGKNPDWQGGQPINLNLKLEENIPTLLRSLQMSGEISERVGKHYEKSGRQKAPR